LPCGCDVVGSAVSVLIRLPPANRTRLSTA